MVVLVGLGSCVDKTHESLSRLFGRDDACRRAQQLQLRPLRARERGWRGTPQCTRGVLREVAARRRYGHGRFAAAISADADAQPLLENCRRATPLAPSGGLSPEVAEFFQYHHPGISRCRTPPPSAPLPQAQRGRSCGGGRGVDAEVMSRSRACRTCCRRLVAGGGGAASAPQPMGEGAFEVVVGAA
jgi:hypothetical protein